jgi:hypothetical protein
MMPNPIHLPNQPNLSIHLDVHLPDLINNPNLLSVDLKIHDLGLEIPLLHNQPNIPLNEKWIWVFCGGGAKGSIELGDLLYIHKDYNRYKPVAICSTSVGSINAIHW